jgi:nucleotide-binding universal stress UspA family protein
MASLLRILVPVDFSDECRAMLRYAKLIAERDGAEITLLHVVSPSYADSPTGVAGPDAFAAPPQLVAERTLQMATFGADELRGAAVRRLVYEGDPAEQIAGIVRAEDIDLVAMPTHGMGLLRRFLIGSVTAKVLHDVSCPVLTGVHVERPPHQLPLAFSNIVCGVDLDGHGQETLAWAAQFASDFQARLNIVHAVPALVPGFELPFSGDWKSDVTNLAREDLGKLVAAVGADVEGIYVEEGETPERVCSFARSRHADLLVIGRGAQEGVGARLHANAYAIIRESPCPVVSV